MKKFLILGLSVAAVLAFSLKNDKTYKCTTVGITFSDGNQTRSIPATPKTIPLLKKSLKNFYSISVKKMDKIVNVKVGKDEENLTYSGLWRGYKQYKDKVGAIVFMPDKNASTNNAALVIPSQRLVIFYTCQ